jgi:hypothetical protein
MEWEQIDPYHQRAKVFGGWLVKVYEDVVHETPNGKHGGWDWRIAMTFVPDHLHVWKLEDDK